VSRARSKRPACGVLPKISVMICAVALGPAPAAELPPGKGRETFGKVCSSCHDVDIALQMRQTRSGWINIIKLMKDMGADATAAQFNEIIDYLTEHFGKEPTGKASPQGKKPSPVSSITPAEPENPQVRRLLPWDKHPLRVGQALYRENCVVCHDVDAENSKKLGPSFYHLFQREQMPRTKMKPSRSYVAAKIRAGGNVMPSFGKKLTPSEINALIDYLEVK
jgi:mono/diheme cytochrome c family protein